MFKKRYVSFDLDATEAENKQPEARIKYFLMVNCSQRTNSFYFVVCLLFNFTISQLSFLNFVFIAFIVKNAEKRCVELVKKIEDYFDEFKYENILDR